jgi:hypothetical protein
VAPCVDLRGFEALAFFLRELPGNPSGRTNNQVTGKPPPDNSEENHGH